MLFILNKIAIFLLYKIFKLFNLYVFIYNVAMKYAIVTDSSIGLTKAQTEKLGWFFLPLNLVIDGVNYADGVDITSDTLFEKIYIRIWC